MCVGAVEHSELIARAADVSRIVLAKCYGVVVSKAIRIDTPRGFDQVVASMAEKLRGKARSEEAAAVRAALATLDVDWTGTDASQRRRLVDAAMSAAGKHLDLVPTKLEAHLEVRAHDVVDATRSALRDKMTIGANWNAVDKRIAEHLVRSTGNFVTDEYKRRNAEFGELAKKIVDDGVAQGLGREQIARNLDDAARGRIEGRSKFYWEVIAGAFVGRGRSFAQLSGYAEAGIDEYQIVSVLDERTTQICRYLDGKTFTVASGLRAFGDQEKIRDPEQIKKVNPWGRIAKGPNGQQTIFVNHARGRQAVAVVERSGFGARDDAGTFSRGRSARELENLGLGFPPYHGLCRTTTVPV